MLEWKKCCKYLKMNLENQESGDNIYKRMSLFNPFGQKDGEFKEYQKLHFIRSNIENINEDEVDDYSVAIGRLLRWLKMTIDLRIQNVRLRRKSIASRKQEREEAIESEQERTEKREADIEEKLEVAMQQHEDA